jgi:hypothetical protein
LFFIIYSSLISSKSSFAGLSSGSVIVFAYSRKQVSIELASPLNRLQLDYFFVPDPHIAKALDRLAGAKVLMVIGSLHPLVVRGSQKSTTNRKDTDQTHPLAAH